jgi:hypothetical protein
MKLGTTWKSSLPEIWDLGGIGRTARIHNSMFITLWFLFGWFYFFTAKWSYPDGATYAAKSTGAVGTPRPASVPRP